MAPIDSTRVVLIAKLRIPSGNNSTLDGTPPAGYSAFVSGEQLAGFKSIMIATNEDVFTGTINVKVLYDHTLDALNEANYVTLQSPPGTAITLAALTAVVLTEVPFPALILQSSGAEGDDADFFVYGKRF